MKILTFVHKDVKKLSGFPLERLLYNLTFENANQRIFPLLYLGVEAYYLTIHGYCALIKSMQYNENTCYVSIELDGLDDIICHVDYLDDFLRVIN